MQSHFKLIFFFILSIFFEPTFANAAGLRSFADIAEKTIPGVVNIRTKSYIKRETDLDIYSFFLQGRVPTNTTTSSLGSGVIFDRQGHIITNYHVIKGASTVEVLFAKSKRKVNAKVVGIDPKSDLALLKVKTNRDLKPLSLGDSDRLRIRRSSYKRLEIHLDYSHTVTSGIISAKGRVIGTWAL